MAWGAALVGHAHPKVVEAAVIQAALGANFTSVNTQPFFWQRSCGRSALVPNASGCPQWISSSITSGMPFAKRGDLPQASRGQPSDASGHGENSAQGSSRLKRVNGPDQSAQRTCPEALGRKRSIAAVAGRDSSSRSMGDFETSRTLWAIACMTASGNAFFVQHAAPIQEAVATCVLVKA